MYRLGTTLRIAFSPNGDYNAPNIRAITINDDIICSQPKNIATSPRPQITEQPTRIPIPRRTTTVRPLIQTTTTTRIPSTSIQPRQKECTVPAREAFPTVSNGEQVPDRYYPWHVSIFKRQGTTSIYICGGSIISKEFILTAAHCLHEENRVIVNSRLFIRVGSNLRESGDYYSINTKQIHSEYDVFNFKSDIALLQTNNEIVFTRIVRPVCYTATDFTYANVDAWVINDFFF